MELDEEKKLICTHCTSTYINQQGKYLGLGLNNGANVHLNAVLLLSYITNYPIQFTTSFKLSESQQLSSTYFKKRVWKLLGPNSKKRKFAIVGYPHWYTATFLVYYCTDKTRTAAEQNEDDSTDNLLKKTSTSRHIMQVASPPLRRLASSSERGGPRALSSVALCKPQTFTHEMFRKQLVWAGMG